MEGLPVPLPYLPTYLTSDGRPCLSRLGIQHVDNNLAALFVVPPRKLSLWVNEVASVHLLKYTIILCAEV